MIGLPAMFALFQIAERNFLFALQTLKSMSNDKNNTMLLSIKQFETFPYTFVDVYNAFFNLGFHPILLFNSYTLLYSL